MDYRHWLEEAEPASQLKPESQLPPAQQVRAAAAPAVTQAPRLSDIQSQISRHEDQRMLTWKLITIGTLLLLALLFFCLQKLTSGRRPTDRPAEVNSCPACIEAVPLPDDQLNQRGKDP